MTDNELNVMVAVKIMGREVYQGELPYDRPVLIVPGSWGWVEGFGSQPEVEDVPDYANDIAAAFTVAEKLKIAVRPSPNEGEWYAGQLIQLDDGIGTWITANWVRADTAARAICLVALETMGDTE